MTKRIGYWSVFLLVLSLAAAAEAQQGPHPGGPTQGKPGGGMGMGMGMGKGMMHGMAMHSFAHLLVMNADELKLTDEQIGKLHRLEMRNDTARMSRMGAMRSSMMAFHGAVMDPAADDAAIRAAAKQHQEAMNAMMDSVIKERAEALALLTDAQRKSLKTMKLNPHDMCPAGVDCPMMQGEQGTGAAPKTDSHQH